MQFRKKTREVNSMQRKDVLELKRRMKKEECTIARMAGCYVNAQKDKVVTLNELFSNLPEEEYFKYLDIAKKSLSGTLGNNLLELSFPTSYETMAEEDGSASKQQFFLAIRNSRLEEEALLDRLYDLIIDHYDYSGNYLILVYHDTYDVMVKTEDGRRVDESEEVYTYFICALCPVTLSKPGLGYLEEENKIGVRLRDWIVGAPENGFLFPAFSERSSDINSLLFYTKNTKEPHPAFMENGLGCSAKRTSVQQKKAFENVVKQALAGTEESSEEIFLTIQESLSDLIDQNELTDGKDAPPVTLSTETFKEIVANCELNEYIAPKLEKAFEEEFSDGMPTADAVLDAKMLAKNEQVKKEKELVCEVANLKKALSQVQLDGDGVAFDPESGELLDSALTENSLEEKSEEDSASMLCDIFLRMKPERASLVSSQIIDGKKCLVIPVEDGDDIDLNGIKM